MKTTTHEEVRKLLEDGFYLVTTTESNDKFFTQSYFKHDGTVVLVKYHRKGGLNVPEVL